MRKSTVVFVVLVTLTLAGCSSKTNSASPTTTTSGASTAKTGTVSTVAPTTVPPSAAPPATVAPTTAPPVTAPPTTAACYIDPEGNCYKAGEFCPDSLHGQTVQGESGQITCENNNGWRWEPA